MFETFIHPDQYQPEVIDHMLERGWFRMGQSMFTTDFVLFQQHIYRTIWLRHRLQDYRPGKTFQKLSKRNQHFTLEIKSLKLDDTHENLFAIYREAMPFQPSASLEDLLFGFALHPSDVFQTYEINLWHKHELIGCSYFDIGFQSMEGISSFYHPAYASFSIGKYLIYQQLHIAQQMNLQYFYPGYFVPGYSHLDYKLHIGQSSLEYFDSYTATWHHINHYHDQGLPIELQLLVPYL